MVDQESLSCGSSLNLKIRALSLIFICLFSYSYANIPWIVYGTTLVPAGNVIDNPIPNSNGVVGEIISLPYLVPEGYELVITNMQVEGPPYDNSVSWSQFGMGVWLGTFPCTNAKWIASCTTIGGSHQNNDMNIILKSGTILNIRLMSNTQIGWIDGWYVQGYLQSSN